jgi:Haem-degrading
MFIAAVDDCGVIKMSSRMDGNSQASVTVVPPKAVTANAFRTPTATLAQVAGEPTRLASIVGAGFSLAGSCGDASRNCLNPQEASNDGTDPVRAARWRIRHRSGG